MTNVASGSALSQAASLRVNGFDCVLGSGSRTITSLASLYIADAPTTSGGGTSTVTNGPYALLVDAGDCRFDANVTMPGQPAFLAQPSSNQEDITADGSPHTIVFGTERFDQGANFASNTFTAPVTGKYQLNVFIALTDIDTAATYVKVMLRTSNRDFNWIIDPNYAADLSYFTVGYSVVTEMEATDTAFVMFEQSGGAALANVTTNSSFSGFLAC